MDEPYDLTPKQIADYEKFLDPRIHESFLLASRNASKTYDSVKGWLWYASIGYFMVMFSATAPMMTQPKMYADSLCTSTFLKHAVRINNMETKVFKNGGVLLLRNLTEAQIRGLHPDGILIDEECKAKDDKTVNATYPTLGTSKLGSGGIIRHITTSEMGTPAWTTWKRLQRDSPENCMFRHYSECPYISPATIEHARKTFPDWFFQQEYECKWIAPAGRIFTNIRKDFDYLTEMESMQTKYYWDQTYVHFGVDWNPVAGHYLVGTRWNRDKTRVFVVLEQNLGSSGRTASEMIIQYLLDNPRSHVQLENGGTNTAFCEMYYNLVEETYNKQDNKKYVDLMTRSSDEEFDSSGKNKMRMITQLFPRTIMVDDTRTPMVSEWLDIASWDEETKTDDPKVLKDPNMHPFDAFLHSSNCGLYAYG